jgi:phospholipase C
MKPYNPIEHVVIIFKENHTFDNYFGTFPGANGMRLAAASDPRVGGDPPHLSPRSSLNSASLPASNAMRTIAGGHILIRRVILRGHR